MHTVKLFLSQREEITIHDKIEFYTHVDIKEEVFDRVWEPVNDFVNWHYKERVLEDLQKKLGGKL